MGKMEVLMSEQTSFKIGDEVKSVRGESKGNVGKVIAFDEDVQGFWIGVDFGKEFESTGMDFKGHNLDGYIKTCTGWWCKEEYLELAKRKTLVYRRKE